MRLTSVPVAAQDATAGEQAYASSCSGCHGADGGGLAGTFPPLADNSKVLDTAYVTEVIQNGLSGPIDVNGVMYDGSMSGFGSLSDADVADLAAFLATNFQSEPADPGTTTTTPAPPPSAGDADRGEDLFLGSTSFETGGTPCVACHTAGGRGNLGGQSMGPDLTTVLDNFGGEPGLVGALGAPACPVMAELFADTPLPEQERTDLAAFFSRESTGEDKDVGDALF
ncbi:MAG: c-type cytochrome, partial [bacterium]|nr:c-type cytochrome [bacterium]